MSAGNQGKKIPTAKPNDPMRWAVLCVSIGLFGFSMALRMRGSLLPPQTALASDIFGKVGIVFFAAWLAWPTVTMLWNTPSGLVLVGAVTVAGILFVYRPKTILFTGPFLAISALLAILASWLRKQSRR